MEQLFSPFCESEVEEGKEEKREDGGGKTR